MQFVTTLSVIIGEDKAPKISTEDIHLHKMRDGRRNQVSSSPVALQARVVCEVACLGFPQQLKRLQYKHVL